MEFVESAIFTRLIVAIMGDTAYAAFQESVIQHPDDGDLIPGGGGLRKLRWGGSGRGKRGGLRIIYYWSKKRDTIALFYVYAKNDLADLTKTQIRILRQLIKE